MRVEKINLKYTNWLLFGLGFIIIWCLPYFILGSDSFITTHDYLDLTIGHLKNIIHNNLFFSLNGTIPLMEGVPRMSIPFTSPLELKNIFFYLFPGYWAVVANLLLVKICAFFGMFFLLKDYVVKSNIFLAFMVSILFSIVPFYIDYSLSSAGIPLLVYSLLNLYYRKQIITDYIIVIFYALNSSLSLSGLFICFLLSLIIIWLYVKSRCIHRELIYSLLILTFLYLLNNWFLISSFFISSDYISHRVEMVNSYSIRDLVDMAYNYIRVCHYHAGTFSAIPIVALFFVITIIYRKSDGRLTFFMIVYITLVVLICVGVFVRIIPLQVFSSFQFDRFYFLYPSLCLILFALLLDVLVKQNKYIIAGFAILYIFYSNVQINRELINNFKRVRVGVSSDDLSYDRFYDETLFFDICKDLNIPQNFSVKAVSIGMFPSIAEYNGLYCVDGYVTSYSLEYKHEFRKVIDKELEKNETLKRYYDEWGNRCYVFSAELKEKGNQYLCSKKDNITAENLDINTRALKDLGCQYVFSAVDIKNYRDLNLEYVNSYTTDNSYWNIRVYKVL